MYIAHAHLAALHIFLNRFQAPDFIEPNSWNRGFRLIKSRMRNNPPQHALVRVVKRELWKRFAPNRNQTIGMFFTPDGIRLEELTGGIVLLKDLLLLPARRLES